MEKEQIFIIGPGRMGVGIALAFALHHFEVTLIDLKARSAEEYERVRKKAEQDVGSTLNFLRRIGRLKEFSGGDRFEHFILSRFRQTSF